MIIFGNINLIIIQTNKINSYPFAISLDNINFFESSPDCFRMVTHYGITMNDIEKVLLSLKNIVK